MATAVAAAPTPPLELFFRTTNDFRLATLSKDGQTLEVTDILSEKLKKVSFSPTNPNTVLKLFADGTLFLLRDGTSTSVPLPSPCLSASFSPTGAYFHASTKPDGLLLFQTLEFSTPVLTLQVKANSAPFQFSHLETHCALLLGEGIRVWDLQTNQVAFTLPLESLKSFSLCPYGAGLVFATFQVGKGNKPAQVSLYSAKDKVCSTSLFRADEAAVKWSPFAPGDAICKVETLADATGKSYYGETKLAKLSLASKSALLLPQEGASDFEWSPRRHVFAMVTKQGCTLFDGKTAEEVFSFHCQYKNVVRFSPSGRFLVLAGFGNLPGQMEFWDCKRLKKLGSGRAEMAVTHEWSPCGRFFVTTTAKPMNVDNGVSVFTYKGALVKRWLAQAPETLLGQAGLLECKFLPSRGEFPDLPASPGGGPSAAATELKPEAKMSFTQFKLEEKRKKAEALVAPPPPPVAVVAAVEQEEEEEGDVEKQLRKLRKLLRQIEEIEKAGARGEDQVLKLKRKKEVQAKIAKLEAKN